MQKKFCCNICEEKNIWETSNFHREISSCTRCGSTVRIREIAFQVSKVIGRNNYNGKVIGLSDHPLIETYAAKLNLDYKNTFFNEEPLLDISNPSVEFLETAGILISSDVLEHVLPPLHNSFTGHFKVLKPGGTLILTTPYFRGGSFVEKYPWMSGYRVNEQSQVIAWGKDKKEFILKDPVFHGGPGNTLEMRLFAPEIIHQELTVAGFEGIQFHESDVNRFGIVRSATNMGTVTATKLLT
jgi:SAM-dependent methyltransferase